MLRGLERAEAGLSSSTLLDNGQHFHTHQHQQAQHIHSIGRTRTFHCCQHTVERDHFTGSIGSRVISLPPSSSSIQHAFYCNGVPLVPASGGMEKCFCNRSYSRPSRKQYCYKSESSKTATPAAIPLLVGRIQRVPLNPAVAPCLQMQRNF